MFALFSTLAFAYRLFPLIPADKGGGNFAYSRDARICVAATSAKKPEADTLAIPEALVGPSAPPGCSVPVMVIAATESTLYIARSDDRGGAAASAERSAPENWSDGEHVPTIYAISKAKLAFTEYNIQNLKR
jgi:hypothetical protein